VSFNSATDARQVNREQNNPPHGMLWAAFRLEGGAFTVVCRLGRYIPANGRYLRLRREITVAVDDGSTMMLWTIERVPLRLMGPSIHDPIYQVRCLQRSVHSRTFHGVVISWAFPIVLPSLMK
jgi:hypothetical protein